MTEAEWLVYTNREKMLNFLRRRRNERKLRLYALACCRRIWHLLTDERSQQAVEVAEQFVDEVVGEEQLKNALAKAVRAFVDCDRSRRDRKTAQQLAAAAVCKAVTFTSRFHLVFEVVKGSSAYAAQALALTNRSSEMTELAGQIPLLHDIFGPLPFRAITIDLTWLGWHNGFLWSMAQKMYDSHTFTDMPVLADALEQAGCDNADILNHCRQPGDHVKGCWVVDLLLGKQ